jgi:RNA polymerase sigma factor for flagellar operon FliA
LRGYAQATVVVEPSIPATRDDYVALCDRYVPLVHHAVSAYAFRLPGYVDVDDLTGAAFLGLVEAARRFDPDRGVPFEAWALNRIRGAIFDAARAVDFASRRTRSDARRVDAVVEEMTQSLGRRPSDAEVTERMGLSPEDLQTLRAKVHQGFVLSLDAQFDDAEDSGLGFADVLVDADMPPLETLERRELDAYVRDCVASLPDRLRYLVEQLFFHGRTASDLALEMGVTDSRVSQLRSEAMRLLREALGAQYEEIFGRTASGSKPPASGSGGSAPGSSRRGQEVARAAAARSSYAQRLAAPEPQLL